MQLASGYAGQQGVPVQRLLHAPGNRDVHQLGEVAHAVSLHEAPRRQSVNAHDAAARTEETEQQRDERALPRAVRTGETEHFAGLDLERQVVESQYLTPGPAPVALPDVVEVDQRGAMGCVPLGVIPGGMVPTGTVPGAGAHAVHAPAPARWIQRTPSSRRPRRTSEQPR